MNQLRHFIKIDNHSNNNKEPYVIYHYASQRKFRRIATSPEDAKNKISKAHNIPIREMDALTKKEDNE